MLGAKRHLESLQAGKVLDEVLYHRLSLKYGSVFEAEIGAEAILKATNVKGVYEADPKQTKSAKFLPEIQPMEMVKRGLKVMDLTSVTLAMENKIPVVVFDVFTKGNLKKLLAGKKIGTEIKN